MVFAQIITFDGWVYFPEGDTKWEALLQLIDMVECICNPVSSGGDYAYMNDLIVGCLTIFMNELPATILKEDFSNLLGKFKRKVKRKFCEHWNGKKLVMGVSFLGGSVPK